MNTDIDPIERAFAIQRIAYDRIRTEITILLVDVLGKTFECRQRRGVLVEKGGTAPECPTIVEGPSLPSFPADEVLRAYIRRACYEVVRVDSLNVALDEYLAVIGMQLASY